MNFLYEQLLWLFILAVPVACIAWTVTHEEIFREPREYCVRKSKECKKLYQRKFFYLFTCEYCFSHYVTAFFIIITSYKLVANVYMSLFAYLRQSLKVERIEAKLKDNEWHEVKEEITDKKDH